MQENMSSPVRELICINVEKVFDWIVKDLSFEFSPNHPIKFPGLDKHDHDHLHKAVVTCHVVPAKHNPIVILNRENRTFTIDGKPVCLQQLTIQKNFKVTICITLSNGRSFTSEPFEISRCEHVVMCAPKGTNVEVTFTDLDCFVCSTGDLHIHRDHHHEHDHNHDHEVKFSNLTISVAVCQSIQSTFPVTVEFLAEYCEPRAELPFSSCGPIVRPDNCSVVFP